MRPRWPWQERWAPHELGHSLPIARDLKRWGAGLGAAALLALALVIWAVVRLGAPGTEPAGDEAVRRVVHARLAATELPRWEPPGELPEVERPPFAAPPPPPLLTEPHPADPPPPADLAATLAELEQAAAFGAATRLQRARESQPASWLLAYDTGAAFLRTGFADRAERAFADAARRLEAIAGGFSRTPAHHAALAATHYGRGHALLRDDCIDGVWLLKRAVGQLDPFLRSGGAEVPDRRVAFALAPVPLSNLDVYSALAASYLDCPAYPQGYFERLPGARRFREVEYANPEDRDIAEGPFAGELPGCVREDGPTGRCWTLANLNKLAMANRDLLHAEPLPAFFEPFRPDLARLAYNVALLAATSDQEADREGASRYLEIAGRLHREGGGEAEAGGTELGERIQQLGLYLAKTAEDYSALAEAYRGRAPSQELFAGAGSAQAIKGIAWALRERWQALLARGRPEAVFEEVDATRKVVPGEALESLDRFEAAARETLHDALAEEIVVQKRRENIALAAGLRDFRAPWLGEEWPDRADAAWWTPGLHLARAALVAGYLLFLAALVLLYLSVVYPYLMYTADYYKRELEARRRERKANDLPVTGEEIYAWKRRQRGEMP